jgi:hypothetical protein
MTYYIVFWADRLQRLDDNGFFVDVESREAGTLFDDYGHARNAVRRSERHYNVGGHKIVRVEL